MLISANREELEVASTRRVRPSGRARHDHNLGAVALIDNIRWAVDLPPCRLAGRTYFGRTFQGRPAVTSNGLEQLCEMPSTLCLAGDVTIERLI